MSEITLFLIALGLAMDAFAVSVASGVVIRRLRVRHALLLASFFGGFQAAMPVLGWFLGRSARGFVEEVDHWLAFGLLLFVGGKMIYEARFLDEERPPRDPLNLSVLLLLAVATSLDAFAVGLSLSMLGVPIAHPALVIGAVAFAMSFAGVYIGDAVGHFFERRLEVAGGAILIGIGVKILLDHLL